MVTIRKLATSTDQMTGMLRRIRNKRHGLGEKEAIRLVHAFAISRITHGTAYLRFTKTELKKLSVVIKNALKWALGVAERTPTERLMELGAHNSLEELWLPEKLKLEAEGSRAPPSKDIPLEVRAKIKARCILALGLEGAFDNVTHASILECLNGVHCGKIIYDYVRSFLTGRQATLTLGNITSQPFTLGPRGTPQGAVLSPLLFTLAMWSLLVKLNEIPGIERAIRANDITIWCKTGSDTEVEERLQGAV
ncbi:hypothetical protein ISCGN_023738 [Ixodes scapularis]